MGRLANVAAALLLPLAFAGCTVQVVAPSAAPQSQETIVAQQPASEDIAAKFDAAFVKQYKEYVGSTPSNETVLAAREVGHATCEALAAGASGTEVAQVLTQGQSGNGLKAVIVAAGVGVGIYCPQYISRFSG